MKYVTLNNGVELPLSMQRESVPKNLKSGWIASCGKPGRVS